MNCSNISEILLSQQMLAIKPSHLTTILVCGITDLYSFTYMALLVKLIIGELELVKVDDHFRPVRSESRGVRMDVEAGRRALLLEALHPGRVLVLVAVLVHRGHVHEQDVVGVGV